MVPTTKDLTIVADYGFHPWLDWMRPGNWGTVSTQDERPYRVRTVHRKLGRKDDVAVVVVSRWIGETPKDWANNLVPLVDQFESSSIVIVVLVREDPEHDDQGYRIYGVRARQLLECQVHLRRALRQVAHRVFIEVNCSRINVDKAMGRDLTRAELRFAWDPRTFGLLDSIRRGDVALMVSQGGELCHTEPLPVGETRNWYWSGQAWQWIEDDVLPTYDEEDSEHGEDASDDH